MYAIIETGSKQYKVEKDMLLKVEKLESVDSKVTFDALMVVDGKTVKVGTPTVAGAVVEAEVLGEGKAKKVIVYKYKSKKNERTRQGHRQPYTLLKITNIGING